MEKIYFLSDWNVPKGYHKFNRFRDPDAYAELFPWFMITYNDLDEVTNGDNVIFIKTPADNEFKKLTAIKKIMENNKIFIIQESDIFDWFDWSAEEQELYIDILNKCEAFCYHNEYDRKVMNIFVNKFIKYTSCIGLFIDKPKLFNKGQYVFLPNPVKRFQRGMISHKIASDNISNMPIYSMKYNPPKNHILSFPDSYKQKGIELIDRMNEQEWLGFIYGSKFGIDIHREFSGGNCSLEFGSLGVPLIGNINLDTQRDIFPDLSFEFNDYDNIKKVINLLLNDKDFFEEVSNKALINTKEKYNNIHIVEKFKQEINKLL